ncbi:hypothetical protein IQ217_11785 [Synechocystis salina LEGE 00031]|uniref:Uncharacterized protein n=1 Tax=Synechocystis salina LEGE 00031 TaxID=1828736 RepID=A0ABR9VT25_9SYNC|nr:hypothetical protein [Synechocystis salina]MBE9254510.1 hypothetical protein [Synechocystis salina LEGE 00031]
MIDGCPQQPKAPTREITLQTLFLPLTQSLALALHLPCSEEIWQEVKTTDEKNENPNGFPQSSPPPPAGNFVTEYLTKRTVPFP